MRKGDLVRNKKTKQEGWIIKLNTQVDEPESDDIDYDCVVYWGDNNKQENMFESDLEVITALIYVNVYLIDRAYGGSEEGGWWYDTQDVELSCRCKDENHARIVYNQMVTTYAEENRNRRSDISSVLSEGRFEVRLEAWEGECYPIQKPYYS